MIGMRTRNYSVKRTELIRQKAKFGAKAKAGALKRAAEEKAAEAEKKAAAKERAKEKGFKALLLDTNQKKKAIKMYEKFGFKKTDCILMDKRL